MANAGLFDFYILAVVMRCSYCYLVATFKALWGRDAAVRSTVKTIQRIVFSQSGEQSMIATWWLCLRGTQSIVSPNDFFATFFVT